MLICYDVLTSYITSERLLMRTNLCLTQVTVSQVASNGFLALLLLLAIT